MKLARLEMVNRLASERVKLVNHLRELKLRVSLLGQHPLYDQDDVSLAELCKPVVTAELTDRVYQIDKDLAALGVELD